VPWANPAAARLVDSLPVPHRFGGTVAASAARLSRVRDLGSALAAIFDLRALAAPVPRSCPPRIASTSSAARLAAVSPVADRAADRVTTPAASPD